MDYNASTLIALEIVDAMESFLVDHYGNPFATHWAGKQVKVAVKTAKKQMSYEKPSCPVCGHELNWWNECGSVLFAGYGMVVEEMIPEIWVVE